MRARNKIVRERIKILLKGKNKITWRARIQIQKGLEGKKTNNEGKKKMQPGL